MRKFISFYCVWRDKRCRLPDRPEVPPGKLNPVTIGADRSPWVPIGPVFGGAERELSGVIGSIGMKVESPVCWRAGKDEGRKFRIVSSVQNQDCRG